ncbi:MAG: hypothetical protein ACJA08_000440 [Cyclobacteriaceae bacterium]|jgi:hypothetical protein
MIFQIVGHKQNARTSCGDTALDAIKFADTQYLLDIRRSLLT